MPTDRRILKSGIKNLAWALPLMFIGPSVIHMSFKNQGHVLFIPVLGIGIIICITAVVLAFKGLQLMVKSMQD